MAALTFDTLKFLEELEKAQGPREQARAIVQVVRASHDSADVATKGDLRELELRLHSEIVLARRDTIIWLGGLLIVGFSTVISVMFRLIW